jgi:predicted phage terminase large subunit-like protein
MTNTSLSQLLAAVSAETCTRRFRHFLGMAWPIVEPARRFIPNWHIDAIADHLQAVSEGRISRLLITMPPGHAKSLIVSVLWPGWQWIRNPKWRGIFTSYSSELATRDSVRCRSLLESDWYRQTFQPRWALSGVQNQKDWFENDATGFRMALGVGGKGTGFRGDCLVVDDPLNAKSQYSDVALDEVIFWFDQVMSTRLNDPTTGSIVIIMQRLSEKDLAAHVLRRGGYEHLNLPTEFEPEHRCTTSVLNWQDPRQNESELLFPQLFPAEAIRQAKISLGSRGFAAQHQQRPAPAEGGIFKRDWWRFWTPGQNLPAVRCRDADNEEHEAIVVTLPDFVDEIVQSWDCSFKNSDTSDYVAGLVLARKGPDIYILDQKHARLDFAGTLRAIREMTRKWPGALPKLIEDAANGPAVIQSLCHELPGIIAVRPLGGKIARANAVSPRIEAGNVYLPHPALAEWVADLIEECAAFPNGRNDDRVDALTQALSRLCTNPLVLQPEIDPEDEDPGYFPC